MSVVNNKSRLQFANPHRKRDTVWKGHSTLRGMYVCIYIYIYIYIMISRLEGTTKYFAARMVKCCGKGKDPSNGTMNVVLVSEETTRVITDMLPPHEFVHLSVL